MARLIPSVLAIAMFTVLAGAVSAESATVTVGNTWEHNLVLNCEVGFEATQYEWQFGDGTNFTKNATSNYNDSHPLFSTVYHTFPGSGTYTVNCVASDSEQSAQGSTEVTVSSTATAEEIAQHGGLFNRVSVEHVEGNKMAIRCDLVGGAQTAQTYYYDAELDEGSFYFRPSTSNRTDYFTFPEQRTYQGYCSTGISFPDFPDYYNKGIYPGGCAHAYGFCAYAITAANTNFNITVPPNDDPALDGGVYMTQVDADTLTYEMWCNIPTWRDQPKHIRFGDGSVDWSIAGERFNHTYNETGNYTVLCAYTVPSGYGGDQAGIWYEKNITVSHETQTNDTAQPPVNYTGDSDEQNENETGNQTETNEPNVNLHVKEWYPKANDFVFVCGNEFDADRFDWHYGDGHKLLNITNGDTYHRFMQTGTFTISCEARSGNTSGNDSMTIVVDEVVHQNPPFSSGGGDGGANEEPTEPSNGASVVVHQLFPQDQNYVFVCNTPRINPTEYSWTFSDGTNVVREATRNYPNGINSNDDYPEGAQNNFTVTNNDIYHTFMQNGEYSVTCTATDGDSSATDTATVQVNTPIENLPPSDPFGIVLASNHVDDRTYAFTCDPVGYSDVRYFWHVDGVSVTADETLTYTFDTDGEHMVQCRATTGEDRYRPGYYEDGFLPCSSSFGCIDKEKTTTINVQQTNETNQTTSLAEVEIAPDFPVDAVYAFVCDVDEFTPTQYIWNFGDGEQVSREGTRTQNGQEIINNDVIHAFDANGAYEVRCTASDGTNTATDTLDVTVDSEYFGQGVDLIAVQGQEGNVTLTCRAFGYAGVFNGFWEMSGPDGYSVQITQGSTHLVQTMPEEGQYSIKCGARSGEDKYNPSFYEDKYFNCQSTAGGCVVHQTTETVSVGPFTRTSSPGPACPTPTEDGAVWTCPGTGEYCGFSGLDPENPVYGRWFDGENLQSRRCDGGYWHTSSYDAYVSSQHYSTSLTLADGFPYDHNYAFECNVEGFEPTSYTFDFGDGTTETRPVFDVYHTYNENGTYDVTCTASDEEHSETATTTINVETPVTEPQPATPTIGANTIMHTEVQGTQYNFTCENVGYSTGRTVWLIHRIADDVEYPVVELDSAFNSYSHNFSESGDYAVRCNPSVYDASQLPEYYSYESTDYHSEFICDDGCSMQPRRQDITIE